MLELCIYKLLKRYFGTERYYLDLVELFLQVCERERSLG